jgi:hypothetical protein
MDRNGLDDQMRRLVLARWLTRRAGEAVGGVVPADASPESLEKLAARLDRVVGDGPPFADVRFDPPYPGRVAEDSAAHGRLVFEGDVDAGEDPLGVVLTVLIAGRRPEVSVAPPSARARRRDD